MKTLSIPPESFQNFSTAPKFIKRSIKWIIWNKLLDILEDSSFSQISFWLLLFSLSILLTFVLTYTEQTIDFSMKVIQWNNFLPLKAAISFVVIFNFQKIVSTVKKMIPERIEAPTGETIEWIPVIEMLDHLFEFESFKRDDIEKKFGIPRNRFTSLAQKLEDIGALVRGENNSRVLNPEFSRSDIASILEWKTKAEDLRRLNRSISPTAWTCEPSKPSIIERVSEFLKREETIEDSSLPSRRFELHKIGL